jgi:hypothetical protein
MLDPITGTPDPTLIMQFLQRCTEAYLRIRQSPPPNANHDQLWEHHQQACMAFRAQLPILIGPENIQIYVACIHQGAAIGAIDLADVGKFNHMANTALAAWRAGQQQLKQQRIQAQDAERQQRIQAQDEERQQRMQAQDAERRQRDSERVQREREQWQEERKQHPPTPHASNQEEDYESAQARAQLPDRKTQNQLMKELRRHGVAVPSERDLRANPLVALNFVDLARNHMDELPPADDAIRPTRSEPAAEPKGRPQTAA